MSEVDNLKKYYKLLFFPAIIIIIAGFFSGFSELSCVQIAKNLLEERTKVLQEAYYGRIETEMAEQYLSKIETYPILTEDIENLRALDATDLDEVKSMEFIEVSQEDKLLSYVSLNAKIRWHMISAGSGYITENDYFIILKSIDGGYKLSQFNSK